VTDSVIPPVEDKPLPRYQMVAGFAVGAVVVAAAFFWSDRIAADFWPIDASRVGPNLLASIVQAVVILVVVALLWPPLRRRIHRFTDQKLTALHMAEKRDRESLHRKMDHIINHSPDIPPLSKE
jgi:preprotein translocase subunit Sec61beta